MVTVSVKKSYLLKLLGKPLSDRQLEDALFACKAGCDDVSGETLSLEVTGDRPDLLSAEGVARALQGHLELATGVPKMPLEKSGVTVFVDSASVKKRPYSVGAVVSGVTLSDDDVADLFQMQEKLDLTHGRRRRKVSIGLYDLDKVTPPFHYRAANAKDFQFLPLKGTRKMNLRQVLEEHPTGVKYAYTLADFPDRLPLLYDSKGEVLALIPIVNNAASAVTSATKNLYIDHTGTDLHAMNASLNILCQHFADRGAKVKTVEIHYANGTKTTPDASPQKMVLKLVDANRMLGAEFSAKQVISMLSRQRITAKEARKGALECLIPAYRADFMHPVDLIEEVAMGHGYNAFEPKSPSVFTKGGLSPDTFLKARVEDLLIGHGFQQIGSYLTTNPAKFTKSNEQTPLIKIHNPVSEEYNAVRSRLLPGLLELLSKNTHAPYPQKVFEIGEVVVADESSETNARTELRLAAVSAHAESGFSEITSVLSSSMHLLKREFQLERSKEKKFLEGRSAEVYAFLDGKRMRVGSVGELHPSVLVAWNLEMPAAAFEILLK